MGANEREDARKPGWYAYVGDTGELPRSPHGAPEVTETQLGPARDLSAAEWVVTGLTTFAASVESLVPSGYPSYVRVFHPAWRTVTEGEPVRWRDIAAANGTTVHPAMQLHALTGDLRYLHEGQPRVYREPPSEGTLPEAVIRPLVDVLGRHTTTERCWFAYWDGFGATRAVIRGAPTFSVPHRRYHLLFGPLAAACESALKAPAYTQSPNIWWPDDRAWCVATEVDLNSTYVGCDETCREAVLAEPALEALEIDPAAGIDWMSDLRNPAPPVK